MYQIAHCMIAFEVVHLRAFTLDTTKVRKPPMKVHFTAEEGAVIYLRTKCSSRLVVQSKRQVHNWAHQARGWAQGALLSVHEAHMLSNSDSTSSALVFGLELASHPAQSKQDLRESTSLS